MLPTSVDLRPELDTVYNQAQDRSCGPHAIANALDCIYQRASINRRHSRAFTWRWSQFHFGGWSAVSAGVGSTFESLEQCLRINGTATDAEWNTYVTANTVPNQGSVTGIQLVRTNVDGLESLKRRLAMGIPIVLLINIFQDFYSLTGDWKSHKKFDITTSTLGEHFVCIIGYDDSANKFLVENSWGADWGDGGFFGLDYDYILHPAFRTGIMHIDRVPNVGFKAVANYTPKAPMYMNYNEGLEFCDRAKDMLRKTLSESLGSGGLPAVVKTMQEWGISDKHLEILFGYPRGTVRNFANSTPELDWSKQIWEQL